MFSKLFGCKSKNTSVHNFTAFHQVLHSDFTDMACDPSLKRFNEEDIRDNWNLTNKVNDQRIEDHNEDYHSLLRLHLSNGIVFEDNSFPADNSVLSIDIRNRYGSTVVWKRPNEIVRHPKFIAAGTSRFDVKQGHLGDCWFLAAVATLTFNEKLMEWIVPGEQSFGHNQYAGIFYFRFWQYGKWVEVVVDDRLPTVDGKLIYVESGDSSEFWSPLLEKAYAKLYGSYENLVGGQICEALEDLCGGLSETYDPKHEQIFDIIHAAYQKSSFIGCATESTKLNKTYGLPPRHAYSITQLAEVKLPSNQEIRLLRLRNPWGNDVEWNRKWSDKSNNWQLISSTIRKNLCKVGDDGEFWMELSDFRKRFGRLDICNLHPDSPFEYNRTSNGTEKKWFTASFEGSWLKNVSSGGGSCYNTFEINPQYLFTIKSENVDRPRKPCAVIIGLMQKSNTRKDYKLPLGVAVFSFKNSNGEPLDKIFFQNNKPVVQSSSNNRRQLTARFSLPCGNYCVVVCITKPDLEGNFLLRFFSEQKTNIRENDHIKIQFDSSKWLTAAKMFATKEVERSLKSFKHKTKINWVQMNKILNKKFSGKFSEESARQIFTFWDRNCSGFLDFEELQQLLTDISELHLIFFRTFDLDHSGNLNGTELRKLLSACGYKVNREILKMILLRFADANRNMSFENFVICTMRLKFFIGHHLEENPTDGNLELRNCLYR